MNVTRTLALTGGLLITALTLTVTPAHAQSLYVANSAAGTVSVFGPGGSVQTLGGGDLNQPVGLAFGRNGDLYVADGASNEIYEFSTSGALTASWSDTHLSGVQQVAFDALGDMFVSNYDTNDNSAIIEFGPTGTFLQAIGDSSNLDSPEGLAFDGSGNLYAANLVGSTISEFSPTGTFLRQIQTGPGSPYGATGLSSPYGLAFDGSGNLYTANFGNSNDYSDESIGRFAGGAFTTFTDTHLNGPTGLAFDGSGNLYAANIGDGTISEFDTDGTFVKTIGAGVLSGPAFLTFGPNLAAAPEPSAWAALLSGGLGLGILLLKACRRKSCER